MKKRHPSIIMLFFALTLMVTPSLLTQEEEDLQDAEERLQKLEEA
jgi:hypothetical protein